MRRSCKERSDGIAIVTRSVNRVKPCNGFLLSFLKNSILWRDGRAVECGGLVRSVATE